MSSSQKKKIREFRQVSNTTESSARRFLSNAGWNVDQALDAFFAQNGFAAPPKKGDVKKISKVFNAYCGMFVFALSLFYHWHS
jgi:UBA-like domain